MALRPWSFTALTTLAAAVLSLVLMLPSRLDLAYRSVSLHIAFEVAAALIALLVAYLVFGRFRDSDRADDLALVCGLAVTAASNLFFAALPSALPTLEAGRFSTWAAVAGRLAGAALIAFAALSPPRTLRSPRLNARLALAGSAALVAAIAVVMFSLESRLPVGIDPGLAPTGENRPALAGHTAVHVVQLIALVCFGAAAIGFTLRAHRGNRELDAWLACACVVAAFARVHYFLFPSLYSEWVYTGDMFRLAFYVLLLAGAARELARTQRLAHDASVFEERRRLARDLHDGLAQELGFIVMHARSRIAAGIAREELEPIARAAERAVDEARRAISALTRAIDEPLDVAIAQAVEDVAQRSGARVRLELAPDVRVEPATREELLRIAREAVSNAARHAQPNCVTVRLDANDVVRLRVSDDGRGFDPAHGRPGGHGLISMTERAQRLGGELRIESRAEQGTSVELVVPCRR